MKMRSLNLALVAAVVGGCFSPDEEVDAGTESGDPSSSTSTMGTPTGEPGGSGGTSSEPTASSTDPTGNDPTDDPAPTGGTSSDPTGDPTADTDPTAGTDSTGDDPFCGDGNVDPGEECDDGVDNNGLDQPCLPDCNLNLCGDGNIGPGEACDDGADDNVLEAGACAPDCSRIIEEKIIQGSSTTAGGNYQPNPVALADAQCDPGFRALFAVPGGRQATVNTPNTADDIIDWPLEPYTAYTRFDGTPVWITDSTPLLGVRDGEAQPLVNPIWEPCVPDVPNGIVCFSFVRPTGLNNDWTLALSNTCEGWSSNSENSTLAYGDSESDTEYLRGPTTTCSTGTGDFGLIGSWPSFYCVEQ